MADFPPSLPCPLGGQEMRLRYWFPRVWTQREEDDARPFALYWSDQAGFGRLHPAPTEAELLRFYETPAYEAFLGAPAKACGKVSAKDRATRLFEKVRTHLAWRADWGIPIEGRDLHLRLGGKRLRVCDVGCGAGSLLLALKQLGHEVLGLEPNPLAIETCKKHGLSVLQGTAEDLPAECPRGHFDLAMMVQALEHCRDPILALRNATALLKPGGIMLVEVPNHACVGFDLAGAAWFHTDAGRHISFFTPHSLQAVMRIAGLEPVALEFTGYCRQFSWVEAQQEVWDALYGDGRRGPVPPPPRPTPLRQWLLLARTALASAERKYDSFRVYARKR